MNVVFFLVPVKKHNARTLLKLIKKHVAPGSIIHTDCWKAYDQIPELINRHGQSYQFQHFSVNHSRQFITEDGVHTNTIEGK